MASFAPDVSRVAKLFLINGHASTASYNGGKDPLCDSVLPNQSIESSLAGLVKIIGGLKDRGSFEEYLGTSPAAPQGCSD